MSKIRSRLLLVSIIALATILRLGWLDRIPTGFIPEEVSTGWNAYSILKTGRDEWGVRLPLIFRETGGFKLALNSYLIVPFMAVLGPTEMAVRLPTALAGVLAVYLTYFLTKKIWKSEAYALGAALLLTVNPWHVSMGRYGVDVNWGTPLFLLGLIFFIKAYNNAKMLLVAAIFFGLTYFTYFNYVVFTVLFYISLFLIYRKQFLIKKQALLVVIFFLIQLVFLWPYLSQSNLTVRYSQVTAVDKIGFVNRINEHRHACETVYSPRICRAIYNKMTDEMMEKVRRVINHYSTTVYFLYGSQLGLSGMPDRWGLFYPIEFLFMGVGLAVLIRRALLKPVLLVWLLLFGVPSSLASEAHIWRMLTLLPLPQMIGAVGLISVGRFGNRILVKGALVGVFIFFFIRFFADYTAYFPFAQGNYSYFGFRELYKRAASLQNEYQAVVVAPQGLGFDQLYIYYLFYLHKDPEAYQKGDVDREVGEKGWVQVKRIGKWQFVSDVRNIIFSLPDKTLLLTDGTFNEREPLPKKVMTARLLQTIPYANGDPAFKIVELRQNPDFQNISGASL